LELFYKRPTEAARKYLVGLKDKLFLILSKRSSSRISNGLVKEANKLLRQLEVAVQYIPADAPRRLYGRDRHSER